MSAALREALLLCEAEQAAPRIHPVGAGEVALVTLPSPRKPTPNEDAVAVLPAADGSWLVLAVADGVGGRPGGADAARIALSCLRDRLGSPGLGREDLRGAILDAVEEANRKLCDLGTGSATTLALAEIDEHSLRPYHVGDSEVLVVGQRGRPKLRTVAHSPVSYAVEAGLLGEAEAMHHEQRHLITNALGSPDMRIEIGSPLRLAARDTVLVASDGLLDNLLPAEILDIIRCGPLARAATALRDTARRRMDAPGPGEPSKPDDLSFVLYRRRVPRRARPRA